MSEAKVKALRDTLTDRDPFCKGVCPVPEHQLWFYYARGTLLNRFNFAHATTEELEALFSACQPASFAFNNRDVLDESYRKAGKMNLDAFATLFDPRSLGIHDIIENDLLSTGQAVELELYKLNVYGKDGFFKAHQDTPRGDSMFGTLVVVLPAPHEGGQLSLRLDDHHWIVDFAEQFSTAMAPSVCFVAFFGDVEHQVLPVTSGHRVTLTYNLHFRVKCGISRALPGPFHQRLKESLAELVNDAEILPNGGYLGIGLCHQYAYDETKPIDSLLGKLKGVDAALATVCKELDLPFSLRLFYKGGWAAFPDFLLLSRKKLVIGDVGPYGSGYISEHAEETLCYSLEKIAPGDLEGVSITGKEPWVDSGFFMEGAEGEDLDFMEKFYTHPVPRMLEVKKLSSVLCESVNAYYGNEVAVHRFYGAACMMISVKPNKSRERVGL